MIMKWILIAVARRPDVTNVNEIAALCRAARWW